MGVNWQTALTYVSVAILGLGLRHCSFALWCVAVAAPLFLYALLADRTKATKLAGKVVLVTGASSGLGRAIALEATRRGCKTVILVARNGAKLKQVAEECRQVASHLSFGAVPVVCDLTSPEDLQHMAELVTREFGAVDLLVNNAGAGAWKHTEETSAKEASTIMACPYQAAFVCSSTLVPEMAKSKTGHILNVTSCVSVVGMRGCTAYAASRWALRGFTRCLYWDMKELGIGVTLLNVTQVPDTEYFDDAPGKAGTASLRRVPTLYQWVDKLGLNYSAHRAAVSALYAVEHGFAVINSPWYLFQPLIVLSEWVPYFVDLTCNVGSAGLRGSCF